MSKKGFTLIEMLLAMFVSTLIIFGIVSTYLTGIIIMKKSGRQLRAQQEAIVTMNQVGKYIRESLDLEVYNFTPPTTWSTSTKGNFLVTYNLSGETSAFYYVNNKMYCVPDFTRATLTNSPHLVATNIKDETYFLDNSGRICFNLEICEPDDTNVVLFSSLTQFTPRN